MSKSYTNRHGHGSGFCSLAYETSGKSRKLITCGSDTLIKVNKMDGSATEIARIVGISDFDDWAF